MTIEDAIRKYLDDLSAIMAMARAEERERCVKIIETYEIDHEDDRTAKQQLIDAIRANH